jgi:hypothetical protein
MQLLDWRRLQLFPDRWNHRLRRWLCCHHDLQRGALQSNGGGRAADRGEIVIHPLQLASAVLVLVFATSLFAGTQFFSQQQFGKQRQKPAIQIAALPM